MLVVEVQPANLFILSSSDTMILLLITFSTFPIYPLSKDFMKNKQYFLGWYTAIFRKFSYKEQNLKTQKVAVRERPYITSSTLGQFWTPLPH